jgi:hypothetical protein
VKGNVFFFFFFFFFFLYPSSRSGVVGYTSIWNMAPRYWEFGSWHFEANSLPRNTGAQVPSGGVSYPRRVDSFMKGVQTWPVLQLLKKSFSWHIKHIIVDFRIKTIFS